MLLDTTCNKICKKKPMPCYKGTIYIYIGTLLVTRHANPHPNLNGHQAYQSSTHLGEQYINQDITKKDVVIDGDSRTALIFE